MNLDGQHHQADGVGGKAGTVRAWGVGQSRALSPCGRCRARQDRRRAPVPATAGPVVTRRRKDTGTAPCGKPQGGPSSVPGIVLPRKVTVKGAPAARRLLRNRRPSSSDLARQLLGTYRKDRAAEPISLLAGWVISKSSTVQEHAPGKLRQQVSVTFAGDLELISFKVVGKALDPGGLMGVSALGLSGCMYLPRPILPNPLVTVCAGIFHCSRPYIEQ